MLDTPPKNDERITISLLPLSGLNESRRILLCLQYNSLQTTLKDAPLPSELLQVVIVSIVTQYPGAASLF